MDLQVPNAINLYLAYAFDLTIIFCFLLFPNIKLPPTTTQYWEVKRLLLGDPTQTRSKYPII